jgi:hypothetical protein
VNRLDLRDWNVIQVGDFRVGFIQTIIDKTTGKTLPNQEHLNLRAFSEFLAERNIHLWVIRGNHDNPAYFKGDHVNWLTNIHFIKDYTVLQHLKYNILCVGGAISIDRMDSIVKQSMPFNYTTDNQVKVLEYWDDEEFVFKRDLVDEIVQYFPIDKVVTHTAPTYFAPYGFNGFVNRYAAKDTQLLTDLTVERQEVNKLYDTLIKSHNQPVDKWLYGHFHSTKKYRYEDVEVRLLGIEDTLDIER